MSKYEFPDEEEKEITRKEIRGLILGLGAGAIYLFIIIYSMIPGLPLSGSLLDNNQVLYIDKLFSNESFFSNGYVFIVTILFVIWGFFYGLGARTIKTNNDIASSLGHSLDGIGKPIVLIFFAATFIAIFKKTNIGTVITANFANIISESAFQGIPLIILLFVLAAISTIFLPSPVARWAIISPVAVPVMMNAGISPEFTQTIFKFSEAIFLGLTPLLAYFVIYLAYMEKYNQEENPITMFRSIKYQAYYSFAIGGLLLLLLIIWYMIGVPIGVGGSAVL